MMYANVLRSVKKVKLKTGWLLQQENNSKQRPQNPPWTTSRKNTIRCFLNGPRSPLTWTSLGIREWISRILCVCAGLLAGEESCDFSGSEGLLSPDSVGRLSHIRQLLFTLFRFLNSLNKKQRCIEICKFWNYYINIILYLMSFVTVLRKVLWK